jgi:hypothetical protein
MGFYHIQTTRAMVYLCLIVISHGQKYSYDPASPNGPDKWNNTGLTGEWSQYETVNSVIQSSGNQCAGGNRPSPLSLFQNSRCSDLHEPLTRQIADDDCKRDDIQFDITPSSLRAYYPLTDDTCVRPTIVLSGLRDPFTLLWMEVHARAEHVVDGRRFDGEIQMVHAGTGNDAGQLATVSVLIDSSADQDNLEFQWLLEQWVQVSADEEDACDGRRLRMRQVSDYSAKATQHDDAQGTTAQQTTRTAREELDENRRLQFEASPCRTDRFGKGCEPLGPRRRMYPYNLWPSIFYFAYFGSLTAPPCTDNVMWRIIDEPMYVLDNVWRCIAL